MVIKENDYPAAQQAYTQAREVNSRLLAANPKDLDARRNVVVIHLNESNLHLHHRNFPVARQSRAAAAEANAMLRRDFPESTRHQRDAEKIAKTLTDIEAAEKTSR